MILIPSLPYGARMSTKPQRVRSPASVPSTSISHAASCWRLALLGFGAGLSGMPLPLLIPDLVSLLSCPKGLCPDVSRIEASQPLLRFRRSRSCCLSGREHFPPVTVRHGKRPRCNLAPTRSLFPAGSSNRLCEQRRQRSDQGKAAIRGGHTLI
jgi:hypothetical protein